MKLLAEDGGFSYEPTICQEFGAKIGLASGFLVKIRISCDAFKGRITEIVSDGQSGVGGLSVSVRSVGGYFPVFPVIACSWRIREGKGGVRESTYCIGPCVPEGSELIEEFGPGEAVAVAALVLVVHGGVY